MSQSNLVSGFKNNYQPTQVPEVQPMHAPIVQQMPINTQTVVEMPSMIGIPECVEIMGYQLQRTHLYIIGVIVLLAIGYFLWKYYNKQTEPEDSEEDEDEDDDIPQYYRSQPPPEPLMRKPPVQEQPLRRNTKQQPSLEEDIPVHQSTKQSQPEDVLDEPIKDL